MLPCVSAATATLLLSLVASVYGSPQGAGGVGQGGNGRATSTASTSAATASPTAACNNSEDLCNRSYDNITHMGAHDSAFLRDDSTDNSLAGNQYYNATVALDSGIRLLQAQVHDKDGVLQLCHSTCTLLDAGTLEAWLAKIRVWMDNNPNEVVTILLVNADDRDVSEYGSAFGNSGISKYGYVPASASATSTWPTLQEMISANTRLVSFVTGITYTTSHSYLLNEFTYLFETPYDVRRLGNFNCTLDRPTDADSASTAISRGMLPLVNHFLYTELTSDITIPDVSDIDTTNSPSDSLTGALGQHAQKCTGEWGRKPVFVLVDFYDQGPSMDAADRLNGITPTGRIAPAASAATRENRFGMGTTALVGFLLAALLTG